MWSVVLPSRAPPRTLAVARHNRGLPEVRDYVVAQPSQSQASGVSLEGIVSASEASLWVA